MILKLTIHFIGFIESIDALELGVLASKLGAGREKAGDKISYEVGFDLIKSIGDPIEAGELLNYWKIFHF